MPRSRFAEEPIFWLLVEAAVPEAAVPLVVVPVVVADPEELAVPVDAAVAVALDVQDTALGTVTPKLLQNLTA